MTNFPIIFPFERLPPPPEQDFYTVLNKYNTFSLVTVSGHTPPITGKETLERAKLCDPETIGLIMLDLSPKGDHRQPKPIIGFARSPHNPCRTGIGTILRGMRRTHPSEGLSQLARDLRRVFFNNLRASLLETLTRTHSRAIPAAKTLAISGDTWLNTSSAPSLARARRYLAHALLWKEYSQEAKLLTETEKEVLWETIANRTSRPSTPCPW